MCSVLFDIAFYLLIRAEYLCESATDILQAGAYLQLLQALSKKQKGSIVLQLDVVFLVHQHAQLHNL